MPEYVIHAILAFLFVYALLVALVLRAVWKCNKAERQFDRDMSQVPDLFDTRKN